MIVGQGGDDAGQFIVVQAGCQVSTCVTVLLFLPLLLQVIGCFGLKDVHHRALPCLQVVRVGGRAGCLRHAGSLVGTRERERQKANASTYRGSKLSV